MIMQRQVLQSCTDPVPRRWCGASASVHRQSVLFLFVNRDTYPSAVPVLGQGCFHPGLCNDSFVACGGSSSTRSSMCQCFRGFSECCMEAFKTISHMFSVLALLPWFSDIISTSSFYLAANLLLCVATVHGGFWPNFFYFLHEKWTPSSPRSSSPWKSEHKISTSSVWQSPRSSVRRLLELFHAFFHVKVDSDVQAQFAP